MRNAARANRAARAYSAAVAREGAKRKCAVPPYAVPAQRGHCALRDAQFAHARAHVGKYLDAAACRRSLFDVRESRRARSAIAGATRGPNAPTTSRKRSCESDPDTSTVCTGLASRERTTRSRATMPRRSSSAATSPASPSLQRAEVDAVAAARSRLADRDRSIGRPQMTQQQGDLTVCELEYVLGQSLLVRALVEQAELAQPAIHAGRMPAVAIARNDELMPAPRPACRVTVEPNARCRGRDGFAVLVRSGRVAERLMRQVAAVADEMAEQHDRVFGPVDRRRRLRNASRKRKPISGREVSSARVQPFPASSLCSACTAASFPLRAQCARRDACPTDHTLSLAPPRSRRCSSIARRPGESPRANESASDGHRSGKPACRPYAFAQIRHHRPLVRPLLQRTIELRQRHRPEPSAPWPAPSSSARSRRSRSRGSRRSSTPASAAGSRR